MRSRLFAILRKFTISNYEWLVLSALLGFIIWVIAAVDSNPVQQRDFSESLQIEYNLSEDEAVLRDTTFLQTNRVTLEIRAPRNTWDVLSSSDVRVLADISDLSAGTHTVELTAEIINDDLRGRVISISPNSVTVRLVDAGERLVQVVPEISNRPAAEYIVNANTITCEPSQITVRGQAPRVARVEKAVVRLNVSALTTTDTLSGSLLLFDSQENLVTNLTIDDENVLCQVEVQPREGETLTVEAEIIGTVPDGYSTGLVTFDPAEIFVVGDSVAITALNGVYSVAIDVTDEKSNFGRVVTVDDLPEGVSLQQGSQDIEVTVEVNELPDTLTLTDVPIRVQNREIGLVATVTPLTATVSINAPQSLLEGITADDISLVVDLTDLGEGEYPNLTIEYSLLTEALQNPNTGVTIQPETATITIHIEELRTPTPASIFGKPIN